MSDFSFRCYICYAVLVTAAIVFSLFVPRYARETPKVGRPVLHQSATGW